MKTRNYLSLLALAAAAFSLNVTTGTAQSIDSTAPLKNRAFATSPRAKEAFPWLTRVASPRTETCCASASTRNALTEARKNRSFAASPRALEQFPELARPVTPCQDFSVAPVVVQDTAALTSPRAREALAPFSRGAKVSTATCSFCRLTASVN